MEISQRPFLRFSDNVKTIMQFQQFGHTTKDVSVKEIMEQYLSMMSLTGTLKEKAKQVCLNLNIPVSACDRVYKAYGNYKRFFFSSPADVGKGKSVVLEPSFKKVSTFKRETPHFREVTIDLGESALPGGVKFPDSAGAFTYGKSGTLRSVTSKRLIHW